MSRDLFDRLRELVPALHDLGKYYDPYQRVDQYGTAIFGPNSLRVIITALTPCECGAVAGQDCAPDCDMNDGSPSLSSCECRECCPEGHCSCALCDEPCPFDCPGAPPAHNIAGSPYSATEFLRDADGRWTDPSGSYGYATRLAGNWICYTDGHSCECGE
jgi:hypothetical protein